MALAAATCLFHSLPAADAEHQPGAVDLAFSPASVTNDPRAIAHQEDGGWIIGGQLRLAEGKVRSPIIRLLEDGSLDETFAEGLSGAGFTSPFGGNEPPAFLALAIQPDNRILVAGRFTEFHGEPRGYIARLNADGTLDHTFAQNLQGADAPISAIALQPDGKILIGGGFYNLNGQPRRGIARLHSDGTLDPTFSSEVSWAPEYGIPGGWGVSSLVVQPDGRVLLAGGFLKVNGVARTHIARLLRDGSLDLSFNPEATANARIESAGIQNNGKIVIGGWFTSVNGQERNRLARLRPDGSLDEGFADGFAGVTGGTSPRVHAVHVQPNQRILIAGDFATVHGQSRPRLARLLRDGELDTPFGDGMSGPNATVHALAIQPDQQVVIAGSFWQVSGISRSRIARLHGGNEAPTGIRLSTDSFAENQRIGTTVARLTALDPDDDVHTFALVSGEGEEGNSSFSIEGDELKIGAVMDSEKQDFYSIRVRASDAGGLAVEEILTLSLLPAPDPRPQPGTLDLSFQPGEGVNGIVKAVARQTDGKILVGGQFTEVDGKPRGGIARLNVDGSLDDSFGEGLAGVSGRVEAIAIQPDGRVLVSGSFTSIHGQNRLLIARLMPDGAIDDSFPPVAIEHWNPVINALALQPDGKILIGGGFSRINGIVRNNIARLNADGTLDATFGNGLTGASANVEAIALQEDGRILVGGFFTAINGVSRNRIARLERNGALDPSFGDGSAGASAPVTAIALQPDRKILLAGHFSSLHGASRQGIGRLHEDGSLDEGFAPGLGGTKASIAVEPNGKILVGGGLLTRLLPGGAVDNTFQVSDTGGPRGIVYLLVDDAGRIIAGGEFAAINGTSRKSIARIHGGYPSPTDIHLTGQSIAENRPAGTLIGTFSASDIPAHRNSHTFTFTGGEGSDGNHFFDINGNVLKSAATFDREEQGTYAIRVRAATPDGLFTRKTFTISVEANEPPTDILLTNDTVPEGHPAGMTVGNLLAVDPNQSDVHSFELVPGEGDEGNPFFEIDGTTLKTAAVLDFQSQSSHSIRVRATDLDGAFVEKALSIGVVTVPHGGQLHVDLSFDPGGGINGAVVSAIQQSDGRWIIGGEFTGVHNAAHRHISRIHPDGSTDHSFLHGLAGASSAIRKVALVEEGILIAGSFYEINGQRRNSIARLHLDGSLDTSFANPLEGPIGGIRTFAVQPDGKIVVAGTFLDLAGRNRVARLNRDGTVDTSFDGGMAGPNFEVRAVAVQPDGKILIAGSFTAVDGEPRNRIARLNQDGSLDTSFGESLAGADQLVHALVLQSDGKILIGGSFSTVNGEIRNRIARLNSDGTLDSSFGQGMSGTDGHVGAIEVEDDDTIFIGGSFTTVNGEPRGRIALIHGDGSLNSSFGHESAGAPGRVDCIRLDDDGRIFIGGFFGFAWLHRDGSRDESTFRPRLGPSGTVNSVVVDRDGEIFIGGRFTAVSGETRVRVARLSKAGEVDPHFMQGLSGPPHAVEAVAAQPDGKVVIAGSFVSVHGEPRLRMTRLNGDDGTLDSTFNGSLNPGTSAGHALVVQRDGKILLGGGLRIARINPNGTIDDTFADGQSGGVYGTVYAVALEDDGSVILGGDFTTVRGQPRNHLARLHPDGWLDESFAPGANGPVRAVAIQPDGKILVGGDFTTINGHPRNRIARLHRDGTLDTTFAEGLRGVEFPNRITSVHALAIQADGRILLGGSFSAVHGVWRSNIARLLPDGTLDHSLRGANNTVRSIANQKDGNIVIAGDFTEVNGIPRTRLARLYGGAASWDGGPSDIVLSNSTVQEFSPAGSTVGILLAIDDNPDDLHIFELVTGESDDGNAFFTIDGDVLKTAAVFDSAVRSTYTIRVRATDLSGASLEKNLVVTVERDRYQVWAEDLPADERGAHDDPGGHGIPNLLRYAFGMDALQPERAKLPQVGQQILTVDGEVETYLTLTYTRRTGEPDLIFIAEASADLLDWHPIAVTEEIQSTGDGIETVTIVDSEPIDTNTKRFLRVSVER
jgi:uncharacterized delta-60 repeat protein